MFNGVQVRKTNQTKGLFFEKIGNIDKPLVVIRMLRWPQDFHPNS